MFPTLTSMFRSLRFLFRSFSGWQEINEFFASGIGKWNSDATDYDLICFYLLNVHDINDKTPVQAIESGWQLFLEISQTFSDCEGSSTY